jgi:L-alanine-DL-glutamate epimerase-like enolase superfamily enzyme
MYLADLELLLIELPAGDGAVRSMLVRLVDDTGREGWGETRCLWTAGQLAARRKSLLAVLAGRAMHDVEALLADVALGNPLLAAGIEMALWDLIARAARQPLCHLWGGAFRVSVPLSVRLWPGTIENVLHQVRTFAAQNLSQQTIVGSGNVYADVQLVTALYEACAHRVSFRLDGRGLYDLAAAEQICHLLPPASVSCLLDPLPGDQVDLVASLAGRSQVALACGATIDSAADVARLGRSGSVSTFVLDPLRLGGLLRTRSAAATADAHGAGAGIRLLGTSGLALAASLHLAASTPALSGGHECSYPKLHDDILTEPLHTDQGLLAVPLAGGLGVSVDRDKVDWYQIM